MQQLYVKAPGVLERRRQWLTYGGPLAYDDLYDWWLLPGCYAAADLYYVAVSGDQAAEHFQKGSKDLCKCACADPNTDICSAGGKTCQKVRGQGANDSENCGGCTFNCGSRSYCSNGGCLCKPVAPTPNKCGELCLDFKTHPRNCGSCGNVCSSLLCYQGACFTPPAKPDKCYPVNAITNGDFQSGTAGWTVMLGRSASVETSVGAGQDSGKQALVLDFTNTNPSDTYPFRAAMVNTTLHLCPGVGYSLDLQGYATGGSILHIEAGGRIVSLLDAVPGQSTWLTMGPYTLPVFNAGDAGTSVSADGLGLDVVLSISVLVPAVVGWKPQFRLTDVAVYNKVETNTDG